MNVDSEFWFYVNEQNKRVEPSAEFLCAKKKTKSSILI